MTKEIYADIFIKNASVLTIDQEDSVCGYSVREHNDISKGTDHGCKSGYDNH